MTSCSSPIRSESEQTEGAARPFTSSKTCLKYIASPRIRLYSFTTFVLTLLPMCIMSGFTEIRSSRCVCIHKGRPMTPSLQSPAQKPSLELSPLLSHVTSPTYPILSINYTCQLFPKCIPHTSITSSPHFAIHFPQSSPQRKHFNP